MPNLLQSRHFSQFNLGKNSFLYSFLPVIFFWAIFDAFVAYVTPNILSSRGYSLAMIGIIIGSSSVWGAVFDIVFSHTLKRKEYRSLFKFLFGVCFTIPILLYLGNSLFVFLIIMAMWGVYYDLYSFGIFEFVSKNISKSANVSSFGLVDIVKALGIVISPLIIGYTMKDDINVQTIILMLIFISFSFIAYLFHIYYFRPKVAIVIPKIKNTKKLSLINELRIWAKVEKLIFPVLILVLFLNIVDAFFWTLGPIIATHFLASSNIGGLFISAYIFPSLFVGVVSERFTKRYGKKKTAFYATLFSSAIMLLMFFFRDPYVLIFIVFMSSILNSLAWPAIKGALSDYIQESDKIDKEIEGVQDFSSNLGYIIGPVLAGLLATFFNSINAFAVIGVIGVLLSIVLIIVTPKHIKIKM